METSPSKILIIEDNQEVRENMQEILQLAGYDVQTAPNGKRGVEMALQHRPDLILCDIMMPELDGLGVLRILSKNPVTASTPFIFLTAKADKEDFRRGMGLGADDYITKPFDDVVLIDSVEMRLERSRRLRESFDASDDGIMHFMNEARANESLLAITADREKRTYEKRDVIYKEGQKARWLYYVVSGKVKIARSSEHGKELIIRLYGPGDFLGGLPILQGVDYKDTATALEFSEIRLIPRDDFINLVYSRKEVSAIIIKALALQLEKTESQLVDLAYNAVRQKVASALLSVVNKYKGEGAPRISLLREDLAAVAGIAKETFIRTLSEFRDGGMIMIDGNDIIVQDTEALARQC